MYYAFFIAKLDGFLSMHVMSTAIQKLKFVQQFKNSNLTMLSYEKCRSSVLLGLTSTVVCCLEIKIWYR